MELKRREDGEDGAGREGVGVVGLLPERLGQGSHLHGQRLWSISVIDWLEIIQLTHFNLEIEGRILKVDQSFIRSVDEGCSFTLTFLVPAPGRCECS